MYPVPLCPCSRNTKCKPMGIVVIGINEYNEVIIATEIPIAAKRFNRSFSWQSVMTDDPEIEVL